MYRFFIPYTTTSDHWFANLMQEHGLNTVSYGNPYAGKLSIKSIFRYAWYSYRRLKKDDVAVFWNPESAIALSVINLLCGRKNQIIALHSFFSDEPKKFRMIWKTIFFFSNFYKYISFTVNTSEEVEQYNNVYGIARSKMIVIPDCYEPQLAPYSCETYSQGDNYIFSGGRSWRDWSTLISAAKLTPNIHYVIACESNAMQGLDIPSNVTLKYNIPFMEYLNLLQNSRLVVLPLCKNIACGLLLLVQSAMMCKPVISTNTPCVRNYAENNVNAILVPMHNSEALGAVINRLYNDIGKQREFAEKLHENIKFFSPENYFKSVLKLLF